MRYMHTTMHVISMYMIMHYSSWREKARPHALVVVWVTVVVHFVIGFHLMS